MKTILVLSAYLISFGTLAQNNLAAKRAAALSLGANFSYLENYWNGTQAKHYGDHVKMSEVMRRKQMLADAANQGIKNIRLPVCFSAWASLNEPFVWEYSQNLAAVDSMVTWALARNLKIIIDLHHPEMDGKFPTAPTLKRISWLWEQIATRYKNTDPEKVIFELWNEPHDIKAEDWVALATPLVQKIRSIAPNHTIILGAHDWNGIDALNSFKPFADPNIIYTFHFYDPFVFTHQGASWTGMQDLKDVPFPAAANGSTPNVPASLKGSWIESAANNYQKDGIKEAMLRQLTKAKQWAITNNVPVYCGEFGSYSEFAGQISRCNHAFVNYQALEMLEIPCSFWEWDGGFNYFEKGSTTVLADCVREAMSVYVSRKEALGIANVAGEKISLFPNPTKDTFNIQGNEHVYSVELIDLMGKTVLHKKATEKQVSILELPDGFYLVKMFDNKQNLVGYQKIMKW